MAQKTNTPPQKTWHDSHSHAWALLGAATCLILAILTFVFFTKGSFAHYSAASIPINKASDQAALKQLIKDRVDSYTFSIDDGTVTKTFSSADAGISADTDATINHVLGSQASARIFDNFAFWRTYDQPVALKVDETKLAAFIETHMTRVETAPKGATLSTETGEIVITPEESGSGIGVTHARAALLGAISTTSPGHTFTMTKQTSPAQVTARNLTPLVSSITRSSKVPISVRIEDRTAEASPATIISWVDPVKEGDTYARFEINSGKVQAWIDSLVSEYSTANRTQVMTTDGDILVAGQDGIEVMQNDDAAKDIVKHLNGKKPYTATLGVNHMSSFDTVTVPAHEKTILADLSNHMLYAFEGTRQVAAFPMSAGAPETPTVVGQFRIYRQVRSQTMRGPNTDGTSYNVPNVEWVSYFHTSYAIHGNYWRPLSTFGSINTSHGCVGMTNANSRWIYEWAPIGTPVITYY